MADERTPAQRLREAWAKWQTSTERKKLEFDAGLLIASAIPREIPETDTKQLLEMACVVLSELGNLIDGEIPDQVLEILGGYMCAVYNFGALRQKTENELELDLDDQPVGLLFMDEDELKRQTETKSEDPNARVEPVSE